jgi:alpha-galactosidase
MWCIMKAPIILGSDLTAIDASTLAVITNGDALSVSQDALGVQVLFGDFHAQECGSLISRC